MIFGQVVTTRCPACYSFNSKVVAWLLQPTFTTLLLGCHKVVTTKYPACYSCNSKVVSPRVQGCCMVVTTYFHKLVARLLLPCDKVIAWMLQPWHFYIYMGCATQYSPTLRAELEVHGILYERECWLLTMVSPVQCYAFDQRSAHLPGPT